MIQSMTGYGKANLETEGLSISVEVKSLNSKFLDVNFRMSRIFSDKELEIRNLLAAGLGRGKVSISVEYVRSSSEPAVEINSTLFEAYYQQFEKLAHRVKASEQDLFKLALQAPDVMATDSGNQRLEEDWPMVAKQLKLAIDNCVQFRKQEGDKLEEKLTSYIESIRSYLKQVEERDPERVKAVRERLRNHINDWLKDDKVDENRFEQEIIYYIEKLDVAEEKVRLVQHLDYFLEVMKKGKDQGKKLGFIAQEIGREINTLGAKANDAMIQKWVVGMKEELEKIKEQVLNIL